MNRFKKFFKSLMVQEHQIIARDEELVKVLKVLDQYDVHDFRIISCGWIGSTSWCLNFDVSGKDWTCIAADLKNANLSDVIVFGKDREEVKKARV